VAVPAPLGCPVPYIAQPNVTKFGAPQALSVYKNYRDAKSLLKRGHEDGDMRTAVSIYADC